MEAAGEPAIQSIQKIISLISTISPDTQSNLPATLPPALPLDEIIFELQNITSVIEKLRMIFSRMYEENRPAVFYDILRPFMTGWENNEHHTRGVLYQGVVDAENPPEPRAGMTDTTGSYQKYAGMCIN
jgi:hypothetical protein